jgi:hypothetical protein
MPTAEHACDNGSHGCDLASTMCVATGASDNVRGDALLMVEATNVESVATTDAPSEYVATTDAPSEYVATTDAPSEYVAAPAENTATWEAAAAAVAAAPAEDDDFIWDDDHAASELLQLDGKAARAPPSSIVFRRLVDLGNIDADDDADYLDDDEDFLLDDDAKPAVAKPAVAKPDAEPTASEPAVAEPVAEPKASELAPSEYVAAPAENTATWEAAAAAVAAAPAEDDDFIWDDDHAASDAPSEYVAITDAPSEYAGAGSGSYGASDPGHSGDSVPNAAAAGADAAFDVSDMNLLNTQPAPSEHVATTDAPSEPGGNFGSFNGFSSGLNPMTTTDGSGSGSGDWLDGIDDDGGTGMSSYSDSSFPSLFDFAIPPMPEFSSEGFDFLQSVEPVAEDVAINMPAVSPSLINSSYLVV